MFARATLLDRYPASRHPSHRKPPTPLRGVPAVKLADASRRITHLASCERPELRDGRGERRLKTACRKRYANPEALAPAKPGKTSLRTRPTPELRKQCPSQLPKCHVMIPGKTKDCHPTAIIGNCKPHAALRTNPAQCTKTRSVLRRKQGIGLNEAFYGRSTARPMPNCRTPNHLAGAMPAVRG